MILSNNTLQIKVLNKGKTDRDGDISPVACMCSLHNGCFATTLCPVSTIPSVVVSMLPHPFQYSCDIPPVFSGRVSGYLSRKQGSATSVLSAVYCRMVFHHYRWYRFVYSALSAVYLSVLCIVAVVPFSPPVLKTRSTVSSQIPSGEHGAKNV